MAFTSGQYVKPKREYRREGLAGAADADGEDTDREFVDWHGRRTTIGRVVTVGPSKEWQASNWNPQTSQTEAGDAFLSTLYTVLVRDLEAQITLELEYPETALEAYQGTGSAVAIHLDERAIATVRSAEQASK